MKYRIAITAEAGLEQPARELAQRLQLQITAEDDPEPDFLLQFADQGLQLRRTGSSAPGAIRVEFVQGKAAQRRRQGEGRKAPLARAVGCKAGLLPRVVDGTAGLGQDALVLATLGCRVTLVEQHPVVHALLEDGLRRAADSPQTRDIVSRMSLVHADTTAYLRQLPASDWPDTVYLDPMYPHRGKKALSKKEMQTFQRLLGADQSGPELLRIARATARKRVAVKRPRKAPFLADEEPAFQIHGAKTRFDIYLPILPADSV